MADQTGLGSIGVDMTKINPYGTSDEQLQTINDALEKNISALQNRYAQPNWFKVAAGFAKPQLGGFIASLGSANEALGENLEKQRESEIPIAQMRSQLALGSSLLSKRKNVSDDIAKWKVDHKGQLPSPAQIAEWAAQAPDLPAVQAMADQQKTAAQQQELQIRAQENALRAAELNRQLGITVPGGGNIESPSTVTGGPSGNTPPTGDSPTSVAGTSSTGARLNAEQLALQSLGIPIISGIRTPEDQAALRDHQDANGNWVTKQGLPVADKSQHTIGNAIDIDSSKLTSQQKQILEALGYSRPLSNDPNHWQKSAGSSAEGEPKKAPKVLSSGDIGFSQLNTPSDTAALRKQTDEKINATYEERFKNLSEVGSPESFTSYDSAISAMIETLEKNPALAKDVINPLAKYGGVLGGILNAAQAGLGVGIAGFAGNVQFPVLKTIVGSFNPEQRKLFDQLSAQAARIAQIQQLQMNVNPGTIRNGEIDLLKNTNVNPSSQGVDVMLYNLYYTQIQNKMLHDMYNKSTDILKGSDPDYAVSKSSRTPLRDVLSSPAMESISSRYARELKTLNRDFNNSFSK